MLNLPASQRLRLALLALPVLLVLAVASPAAATPSYQLQSTDSSQEVTTAGTQGANTVAALPADSDTAGAVTDDGDKDLKVFFVIGMVVNIVMITAFLFWAAGQWRKTRK